MRLVQARRGGRRRGRSRPNGHDALGLLGYTVHTVAGAGPVDRLLPGLAIDAPEPPSRAEVDDALADADLVVIENLCSLPLNPAAAGVVAAACAGRPAVLHHHDLPWQRPHLAHLAPPPDDPGWRHVTINELSRLELRQRGIDATTLYNTFDPTPTPGDRDGVRAALGVRPGERLLLQPTRALARKNVAGALALCEAVDAAYWLLGPAEDGYGPTLDRLVSRRAVRSSWARLPAAAPSPMPTPPAMPSCSHRPGKASAIPRSSRRPTADRWPSGPTRWRSELRVLRLRMVRRGRRGAPGPVAGGTGPDTHRPQPTGGGRPLRRGRPAGAPRPPCLERVPGSSDPSVTWTDGGCDAGFDTAVDGRTTSPAAGDGGARALRPSGLPRHHHG